MKAEHTPIPYFVSVHDDNLDMVIRADSEYEPIVCNVSVESSWSEADVEQNAANAEFICRACNNHEQLIEALQNIAVNLGEEAVKRNDHVWQRITDSKNRAEAALALAEKGE
jgi:hypothetical protein